MVVERRISNASAGPSVFHLSDALEDARIACRDDRTCEAVSMVGSERYRGVGGYEQGVDAVDEGDERGLDVMVSSSILGTHTC